MTHDLSPFARVIPFCSGGSRGHSVSRHIQLLAALLRPASRAEKATEPSPGAASWSIAAMIDSTESVMIGSMLVG
jgi:hypothetical protein